MKKIFLLLAVVGLTTFTSCEGDQGPPGVTVEAQVWELTNVDFLPNSFAILYTYPQQILPSDHVLVYRLSASTNSGADVWQLMPQYYYLPDGTLDFSYNYDFTAVDVNIFIEGNDLVTLNDQFTQNQIFRIVVVPGYFAKGTANPLDYKDYNAVVTSLGIQDKPVMKVSL